MFKPNQYLSSPQIIPQVPICIIKSVLDFLLLNWTSKDEYARTVFSKQARQTGKTILIHSMSLEYIDSVNKCNTDKLDNSLNPVLKT